ncbi:MAG: DUF2283 domain-containing protein [Dehalococcoidia bacterium]|nr:DUF2283 domain-containing protein [Dehalococcoidia bacterium]
MRIVYDASVDILEVYLCAQVKERRHTSKGLSPGIIADIDKAGSILKLEILDARERYSKEQLASFTFERLSV